MTPREIHQTSWPGFKPDADDKQLESGRREAAEWKSKYKGLLKVVVESKLDSPTQSDV